ncbi:MAG TPA: murein L,D-transpeptidase catalytic domain family protein [Prosthecobacter sp.]|nr:murein L,D-transpeptidase catalytic domain family protein [Prosthecobacter sp.]
MSTPTKPKAKKGAPVAGGTPPKEVAMALAERARLGSKCNWVFEVDYSINSSKPRMFVYSIKDNVLHKYKCAHGGGGKNHTPHDGKIRQVSNVPNSKCSSLGYVKTGVRYDSDQVGEAVRLHGLSTTNSNILDRGVVLHGGAYVYDNEAGTDDRICGRSHGCLVVDDQYIDRETGGELIEWLKGGSIGAVHYGGKFTL